MEVFLGNVTAVDVRTHEFDGLPFELYWDSSSCAILTVFFDGLVEDTTFRADDVGSAFDIAFSLYGQGGAWIFEPVEVLSYA